MFILSNYVHILLKMNLSWFYLYYQKLLKIRTSGGGGGFENSDSPGQGEGVV